MVASGVPTRAPNIPTPPPFPDTRSFNLKTPESPITMPKSSSINPADEGFGAQLQTFKNAIPSYAATLDLSPAAVTAQANDADYFSYTIQCQQIMLGGSRQWTAWKDLARYGGDLPPSGAPVAPVFPLAVLPVAPGIEPRFRALVKQVKAHPGYNAAMGQALGIEGAQQTGPDLATIQPDISATINGTRVDVGWDWGGFSSFLDQLELEVDRGQGFGLLAIDTTPGYTDTQSFPAAPAKWTYRAIYRIGDNRVGQWSKPVSVTVGG
ncbi:MAG: hypothetical protein DME97_09530 [Verrucomicrobia bacterium]|nr:MAG: hypothetical protein DME97_09530 [Verrucomicrobiota bacterium]